MPRDVHAVVENTEDLDVVWSSRAVQQDVAAATAAARDGKGA